MEQQQFTAEVLAAEKQLYGVAKSILKSDADCEDAVQSAILNAYANLSALKDEKFFRTWLTRILINECFGIIRKSKRVIPIGKTKRQTTGMYDQEQKVRIQMCMKH